jgi:hypothetical protein
MSELSWSDDQWRKVKEGVKDAFDKASVSGQFLLRYGPLPGSAEIVRNELLALNVPMLTLDGDHAGVNRRLVRLTVNVELTSEQVADETLSNAMLLFRRAGNILALEEDRIVFSGYGRGLQGENSQYVDSNDLEPQIGLADLPARRNFDLVTSPPGAGIGEGIVVAIVNAINRLEARFHPAPFACVLGSDLFAQVHTPTPSLVLPADRIGPLLNGGPLLRSGRLNGQSGIVVSQAGTAVDIVVATEPTVQFLQRQANARFLFRVFERFVLRIRDQNQTPATGFPIAGFRVGPTGPNRAAERQAVTRNVRLEQARQIRIRRQN